MPNPLRSYSNGIRRHVFLFLFLIATLSKSFSQNAIVTENALPGNPYSEWGVDSSANFRNPNINGFATEISVNKGSTVHFKIDGQSGVPFTVKIYRLGYYNGLGARLKQDLGSFTGIKQPAGLADRVTGLLDCRNWTESASWAVPPNAVSGIYIAKLESAAGRNHIIFIVRDDASSSKVFFQTNDATWQAYNGYGGNYFYSGTTSFPNGHAVKVSYNRPFFLYNAGFAVDGRQSDWYMNDTYPMLRWLERNGYDLTYTTSVDVARSGNLLLNHKIFVAAGHEEYVSKEQRSNIEAARNAGVNCAFFTGNDYYWKTRWESDSSGNAFHTLVCFKEGTLADGSLGEAACGTKCDVSSPLWTGLWRMGAAFDAPVPENALTGQISWEETKGTSIKVPFAYKNNRFWRNTGIANLASGQTATLGNFTLGYEWDFEQFPASYPNGRMTLSSTSINDHTHKLSLYRHPSGALVFGAGTIQWAWGLDDQHFGGTNNQVSLDMQQATLNLFADMGVQPGSKQADLVAATASTDIIAPASVITSPSNSSTIPVNTTITITGTASDASAVAGVEISVDGGQTWKVADGTTSWSFSFTPLTTGTFTIRSRGYDDTGNMEVPSSNGTDIISITVINGAPPVCPCNIFTTQTPPGSTLNDGQAIELGVKFRSNVSGFITGVRFYKTTGNSGTHTGELYSSTGARLAQAVFTNETATGWQTVSFSTPVAITANTTYVAAYFSSAGNYVGTTNFFTSALANNPLTALADGTDGANGIFIYTPSPAFPTNFPGSHANYWVDVVFTTGTAPTANASTTTIFTTQTPADVIFNDGTPLELGIKFRSSSSGFIKGISFYKTTGNTGIHTGELYSSTGTRLAQAVFTGETATGWQTVNFSTPVAINANTTYIAAYFSSAGNYTATVNFFTAAVVNSPLTGLADGTDGSNGVFIYSATPAFPSSPSGNKANYWVDAIYSGSIAPTANAGVNQTITLPTSSVTLNGNGSTGTITSYSWTKVSGPNTPVITTPTAVTTTVTGLIQGTYVFQLSLNGGVSTSQVTVTVLTTGPATTIFTTQTPADILFNDGTALELGVKFRSSIAGFIKGVRFYKTTGNTGTHIGELYSSTGTRLAQATFTGETATGWQTVVFSTPVAITANTTYIAAYFSSDGKYAATVNFFPTAIVNSPLTALANGTDGANGVFIYSASPAFPSSPSGNQANYWVDAFFSTSSQAGLGDGSAVAFAIAVPEESPKQESPKQEYPYSLGQNYPNPVYQQNTRIRYSIPVNGRVELVLYDIQGRQVKVLVNEIKSPGIYYYDLNTSVLGKGLYYYRMYSGNYSEVKKMVVP